ncbi:lysylphosphatidylglycerol synthase domain-containing protein [Georgenia subflava]|uniref:Uncharacterized protein n=1 Tax=Georgenia subflava TaxID=1622177 RepID=A0A6N7EPC3_9MICO|nr:lysylphosphatidylglycerol synthase domain-containing protein [Georgenia subflava]MPV38968.1 hypothetical protein [Georgenia subflava]
MSADTGEQGAVRTRGAAVKVAVRWLLIAVAVFFLGRALYLQWPAVSDALAEIPLGAAVASVVAAALAVSISGQQQRSILAALGHRLPLRPWMRVFYLAQLGKYVPGTAWAYVAQMELGRKKGIDRASSVLAILLGAGLTVLLALVAGLLVLGAPSLSWLPVAAQVAVVVLAAAAVLVLAVRPGVVGAVTRRVPALASRLGEVFPAAGSLRPAIGWSAAAWGAYGVHLWLLAAPTGLTGADGLRLAVGGFAIAWVCGFLAVLVPAGVGVREAVLVGLLAGSIGSGPALAVAVLSRFLIIAAEVGLLALVPFLPSAVGGRSGAATVVEP